MKPRSIFDPDDHEPSQTRQPMQHQPANVHVRSDIQQRLALQRAVTSPIPKNDGLAYGNDGHRDGEARDYYDPHLAYGTLPPGHAPSVPPLPTSTSASQELGPANQERELQTLTTKLETLMMEAQCVQHSATTIISSLQKNPDAMAAVALTLAELSNIITKVAPGALPAVMTALKTGSPAIFALLCSPQFLIAGGVAVGVTVVMFGGYKIIKKIQANVAEKNEQKRVAAEAATPEEALPFNPENYSDFDDSVIESWRRGIADVEESAVEDEFITPKADKLRREKSKHRKREETRLGGGEPSLSAQSSRSDLTQSTVRRKPLPSYIDDAESARSERSSRTRRSSKTDKTDKTERSHKSSRSERSDATIKPDKKEKKEKKEREKGEKKPSALRMMFKGSSSVSTKGKEVALRA